MKKWVVSVFPLVALLSSCTIVNPVYPQDELDPDQYQEPIVLDWTNDNEEELEDPAFADEEALRGYLNNPYGAVKAVDSYQNVFNGRGSLQLGNSGSDKEGELIFTLKNTFLADALAISVYPYFVESYDLFTGKTKATYDSFQISINERDCINVISNEENKPLKLTFAFNNPVREITIKFEKGRGLISEFIIYQK